MKPTAEDRDEAAALCAWLSAEEQRRQRNTDRCLLAITALVVVLMAAGVI